MHQPMPIKYTTKKNIYAHKRKYTQITKKHTKTYLNADGLD